MFDSIFQHDWESLLFIITGDDKRQIDFFRVFREILFTRKFFTFKSGDGNRFVLTVIKVFFPVFIRLYKPENNYKK